MSAALQIKLELLFDPCASPLSNDGSLSLAVALYVQGAGLQCYFSFL